MKINIAIDGPSGAGKSTISNILAEKLGYVHLDTGAMYRSVAYAALKRNIALDDEDKEVVDNVKFKYSQSVFPAGTTTAQAKIDKENNFAQAGELYRSFSKKDQDNLIKNLSGALNAVKNKVIVNKMIANFYQADKTYGERLMKATNTSMNDVKQYLPK